MKDFAKYADWVFYGASIPVIFAIYGAFAASDLWLAPTQWLEVSILIVLYSIFLKVSK
jgi:hypothetical protein